MLIHNNNTLQHAVIVHIHARHATISATTELITRRYADRVCYARCYAREQDARYMLRYARSRQTQRAAVAR